MWNKHLELTSVSAVKANKNYLIKIEYLPHNRYLGQFNRYRNVRWLHVTPDMNGTRELHRRNVNGDEINYIFYERDATRIWINHYNTCYQVILPFLKQIKQVVRLTPDLKTYCFYKCSTLDLKLMKQHLCM